MKLLHIVSIIILFTFCVAQSSAAQPSCQDHYTLKITSNLRKEPGTPHEKTATLQQNTSLLCLDTADNWLRITTAGNTTGWIRDDLVSSTVVRIQKNERELIVTQAGRTVFSTPITPGNRHFGQGRYFLTTNSGTLATTWPNREDLRKFLLAGKIGYTEYRKAILGGPSNMASPQLSLCPAGDKDATCGVYIGTEIYKKLVSLIPNGARLEIYSDQQQDRAFQQTDYFSRTILQGALEQLKYPAIGLRPEAKLPSLSYPNGDIQPDFATSSDIVIRSVRRAGVDLQALVHEDVLGNPQRYAGVELGKDHAASHRRIPVLLTYLKHNAVSLTTNIHDNPFSFEPGDIVAVSTGDPDDPRDTLLGIVSDSYDNADIPLVITIGGMGQHTGRKDVLGKRSNTVIGHFRMMHPFDYQ